MDREQLERCLGEIERAATTGAVIDRLRAHLALLGEAGWPDLDDVGPEGLGEVALGIARLRMKRGTADPWLEDVEALFARASVRVAQLHDRRGWHPVPARPAPPRAGRAR